MAVKYIDFAKNKSFMRKELNRKAQSKRLMSAKTIKAKYMKIYYFDTLANYAGIDPYNSSCYPSKEE